MREPIHSPQGLCTLCSDCSTVLCGISLPMAYPGRSAGRKRPNTRTDRSFQGARVGRPKASRLQWTSK